MENLGKAPIKHNVPAKTHMPRTGESRQLGKGVHEEKVQPGLSRLQQLFVTHTSARCTQSTYVLGSIDCCLQLFI